MRRFGRFPIAAAVLLVSIAFIAPNVIRYESERDFLATEARKIAEGLHHPHDIAAAVERAIVRRVRDQGRAEDRPPLRASAYETWNKGFGTCGDVARLIVNMLQAIGISASRIILTDEKTGLSHVGATYQWGRNWLLVGQNTPEIRRWANTSARPLEELIKVGFRNGSTVTVKADNPYFTNYSFFNWGRFTRGWLSVNQYRRFPDWLNSVVESPSLIMALAKLAGILLLSAATGAIAQFLNRPKRYKT